MVNSYRTVTKQSSPGSSKELDYVVNIYHKGKFKFAYRYKDWSEEAVTKEVIILRSRFAEYCGYTIENG